MRKLFKIALISIGVIISIILILYFTWIGWAFYIYKKYPEAFKPLEIPAINLDEKTPVVPVSGKIIFFSHRPEAGLYIVESGQISNVTNDAGIGVLSKDGTRVMHFYDNSTLAIRNVTTSGIEEIIKFPEPYDTTSFDWSPDGKYICFTDDPIDDNKSFNNLYTYNIETNEVKQLTFFTGNTSWSIVNPKYSPNGSKIVFECPKNIERGDFGAPISLFVINSDGTGLHELFGDKHLSGIQPSWSPDGKKIVFISMGKGEKINYADVYIYDITTKEIKQLTDDYWQDEHPVFSPDGKQICYVSPRHGDYGFGKELFVINTDGTGMARVTPPYRRENAKGIFAKWAGDDYPQWSK